MFLDNCIFDIAYSTLGIAPINTEEHYRLAAACGFPALKGDVRPTSDGGLIMCHDNAFTFDDEGLITRFDRENCRKIIGIPFSECASMHYSAFREELGYCAPVTTFDTFVRVCRDTGKIAYATIRNDNIPDVITEVFRILRKYGMEEHCMINSFTYEVLTETRKHSTSIPVSQVQPHRGFLKPETVRAIAELGNSYVTMFSFPDSRAYDFIRQSEEALNLARTLGVGLHQAQVHTADDRTKLIELGFTGFHIMHVIPPYSLPSE